MSSQAADHQRIFSVLRDGALRYGDHQGLHEEMACTELAPCPTSPDVVPGGCHLVAFNSYYANPGGWLAWANAATMRP